VKTDERKIILLVEDEFLIAMGKQQELEKYGYSVRHVNTGEKAVNISRENCDIDLILMDIDLGKGIDGTEAAALILKERNIPVIFVSSHTEKDIVEKTEKITSYGYVVKSSSITVLDASIKMAFKLFDAQNQMSAISKFPGENPNPVLRISEDGSILYTNQVGKSLIESWEDKECVPDYWKKVIENVLAKGIGQEIEEENNEKLFSLFFTFVSEENYVNVYGHDITERKQAEEKEKIHHSNIDLLSKTAMRFVEFPQDGNI